jgi:hypothetical protein
MYKILSVGTSFNYGLGLHFYKRKELGLPINFNVSDEERYFNYKNSYSVILGEKLKLPTELAASSGSSNFLDAIRELKKLQSGFFKPKVIILQLTNVHRDFFIYDDKIYKLDFETYDGFIKSKKELIDNVAVGNKLDFVNKLNAEIELFLSNEVEWRKKQTTFFINRINELDNILKDKNIILKVISYSQDYKENIDKFNKDLFVKIDYKGIQFSNIFDFVNVNKLRIKDDIGVDDDHPNFKAHQIVADSLYESIIKHLLYSTI